MELWGDFLKQMRAQRLGVYCGIMKKSDKNVVQNMAQRKPHKNRKNKGGHEVSRVDRSTPPFSLFCEKRRSKGWLFRNLENRKLHQNQIFK